MRNLNVWYRLGIVLSGLWVVGMGGYTFLTDQKRASDYGVWAANICLEGRQGLHQPGQGPCWKSVFRENYDLMAKSSLPDTAFMAFVPLPFFWLIVWGAAAVVRWVLRGRELKNAN